MSRPWAVSWIVAWGITPVVCGTTIIPPVNLAELGKDSHAVVLARAQHSWCVGDELLATRTLFQVEETLRGGLAAGRTFEVEVPGGVRDDTVQVFPGSPAFEAGESYLLPLLQVSSGVWTPRMASYGILQSVRVGQGRTVLAPLGGERGHLEALPRPDGRDVEPVHTYQQSALVGHLRDCLSGRSAWDLKKAAVENAPAVLGVAPPGCNYHFITGAGGTRFNFRWLAFDEGGSLGIAADQSNDAQVNALALVPAAVADWNNVAGSSLNISYSGTVPVAPNCASPDPFTMQGKLAGIIVFNDPCRSIPDLSPAGGVVAQGGFQAGLGGGVTASAYAHDGCTFWAVIETWFVLVNNNVWGGFGLQSLPQYQSALTHELGHGLGFDHVSDPAALMNGTCCNTMNATDVACASYAYADLVAGIGVSTSALNFGTVNVNVAAPNQTVTISSVGTRPLLVSGIAITSGANLGFSVAAPGNVNIHPCATTPSFPLQVGFRPTTPGNHTGTLTIPSNDPDSSPFVVTLTGSANPPPAPEIDVSPLSVDFGTVNVSQASSERTITIRNTGNANLSVASIAPVNGGRGFSRSSGPASSVLAPNGTVMVGVRFTPTGAGAVSDTLRITSNDGDEALVNVNLTGTGAQPGLEVTPPSLVFGDVQAGESRRIQYTLRNTGTATLNITSIALAPGTSAEFQLNGLSVATLTPNATLNLSADYAPVGPGPDNGSVLIASNLPGAPQVSVPLSGNGTEVPGGLQTPGDCNQDGAVDISDPVCLLGFLFLGRPSELPCGSASPPEPDGPVTEADFALMDWNGDRSLDLSDVVASLNAQFAGTAPHVLDTAGAGRSCVRIRGCPNVCRL